jgi:hypothetical protein
MGKVAMLILGFAVMFTPVIVFAYEKFVKGYDWKDFWLPFHIGTVGSDGALGIVAGGFLLGISLMVAARPEKPVIVLTSGERKVTIMYTKWKRKDLTDEEYRRKYGERSPWRITPMPSRSEVMEMNRRLHLDFPQEFINEF